MILVSGLFKCFRFFEKLSTAAVVAAINRSLGYIGCVVQSRCIYLLIAKRDIDLVYHVTPILLLVLLDGAFIVKAATGARAFHV